METTMAIIKPDAVRRGFIGDIIRLIQSSHLHIRGMRMVHLTRAQAERFYEVHKARPFFNSLCSYMTSGPVVALALEGEGAIAKWRDLMGATDPAKASPGTIRKEYGIDVEQNAAHGSDAVATAAHEVPFFFRLLDLVD